MRPPDAQEVIHLETVTHNPTAGIYPATPDYLHAIEVRGPRRLLYLSGTMGLDPRGVPGRTLDEQLTLLRDASYAEANQNARVAALGGRLVPTTALVVQTLSPDWLVELEIIAAE